MDEKIIQMLQKAYAHLGVTDEARQTSLIRRATHYLSRDRERYIELGDADTPEYCISVDKGIICHMVPLAMRLCKEPHENKTRHECRIFYLAVTENQVEYVLETSARYTNAEGKEEGLRFPLHRRADPANLEEGFSPMAPNYIVPVASHRQRNIFRMVFLAIAKFSANHHINTIPRKTERAVFTIPFLDKRTISLADEAVTGSWLPLAQQGAAFEEYRADHSYSYHRELGLLITENTQFYVMKTTHIYRYFRKIIYDDTPGACSYEPTEEKQETTYEKVELDQIRGELSPTYFY